MDCLRKAVLRLTVQCTQCHTHKFDPITHDEHHRMFAALNDTYEATSRVFGKAKLASIERVQRGVEEAADKVKREQGDWTQQLARWEESLQ